jgi:hypothetical protein
LATAPKLTRTLRIGKVRKVRAIENVDMDAVRARRATADRTLTVLKAALNQAFREGRGAVALGRACLFSPLSSGGALVAQP